MHKMKSYPFIVLYLFACLFNEEVFAQKPVISSFSPTREKIGSTVIITGNNFSNTTSSNFVYFGDVKARVVTASATSLSVIVPAGAGYKPVSVTVNGLTAYSSLPFSVSFPGDGNDFTSRSYASRVDSSWGFGVNDISASDLDGDGDLDPVLVRRSNNLITILKNNSSFGNISLPYSSSLNYATGNTPVSVSFGDFDGDGRRDLAVVNSGANSLSVFKNNSSIDSIRLLPKLDLTTGSNPSLSIISDIDNDGRPDIVCTNSGSNNISILRNTSSGGLISFAPKADFTTGTNPYGLAMADLDGDGVQEIVVANENDNSISIFKNNSTPGTLSLGNKTDIANVYLSRLTAADLDGDGKTDIAGSNFTSFDFEVLRNTSTAGNFSFAPLQHVPAGFGSPAYLSFADIDGDGKVDVAFNHINYSTVSILKNKSTPGVVLFSGNTDFFVGQMPSTLVLADLDNDARPDIISAGSGGSALSILRNLVPNPYISAATPVTAGNGSMVLIEGNNFNTASLVSFGGAPASSFLVQSPNTIKAVVDTGATGEINVTTAYGVARFPGFTFSKLPAITSIAPTSGGPGSFITINGTNLNNVTAVSVGGVPAVSFTVVSPTLITATVAQIAPGNYDVAVTNPSGTATLGNFYTGVTITSFFPTSGPVGTIITITGTHFSPIPNDNIVYAGPVRATVIAATPTSLSVVVPPGSSYQPITVTTDHLTAYSRKPFIITFRGTGNEFTATSFADRLDSSAGGFPVFASTADLNNDGKADVITANFSTASISVSRNTSSNNLPSFQRKVDYVTSNYALSSAPGDLDGDGKTDLVVLTAQNGVSLDRSITVFKNVSTPDTILLTKTEFPVGILNDNPAQTVVTDLDGDGKPDVAVLTYSTVSILRNTSTVSSISFAPKLDILFSQILARSIFTADVDGDGKTDFVVTATGLDKVYIIRNTSKPGKLSFAPFVSIATGFGPSSVSLADLDNDDKPDMVIINRGNNSVSLYKNRSTAGAVSFDNPTTYQLGVVADNLATTDLDGDARLDIAIVTNSDRFVYVLKNTGLGGSISFADKIKYDAPFTPGHVFIADLTGDGKPDILTNNPNGNNFSVLVNECNDDVLAALSIKTTGPTEFCAGGNVVLKTSSINGATYQWYREGIAISSANDSVLVVTTAGVYTVKADSNGIISSAAPIKVSVKDIPPAPVLTASGATSICQGMGMFLHSSTTVEIAWYKNNSLLPGMIDSIYWVNMPGSFKLLANSNGCQSAFSNQVTITVNPIPNATITAAATLFCSNDSVTLNANNVNGYSYQWTLNDEPVPGASAAAFTAKNEGNYAVRETGNGCAAASSDITLSTKPAPPKPVISLTGSDLRSSAAAGNQWYKNGIIINGATTQQYTPPASGNYTVEVTQNGCKSLMSETYSYAITGIISIDNLHFIRLSPNPVKDKVVLNFNLNGISKLNMDIIDLNGRLLQRWQNLGNGRILDLSLYAGSIYLAKIYSDKTSIQATLKLVKQ
jgi:hypothetical protein